jgi:hypothetical protein
MTQPAGVCHRAYPDLPRAEAEVSTLLLAEPLQVRGLPRHENMYSNGFERRSLSRIGGVNFKPTLAPTTKRERESVLV